jgi:hypothetical protein
MTFKILTGDTKTFSSDRKEPLQSPENRQLASIANPQTSQLVDKNDNSRLRHGRQIHVGEVVGAAYQSVPMLFSRDGHNIWLGDCYKNSSAFLILGGPSFANVDQKLLDKPGFLTMAVNNSVKSYRPNMWTCVDDPTHFIKSIWLDPKIQKFVPYDHAEKNIFDNERWEEMSIKVGDCPNVMFFKRNEHFNAERYLFENTINWGNHGDLGGGRSVMLVAIRLLYILGIRNIYLLGCDFNMSDTQKYHFEQDRSKGSINGNNSTYGKLIERFGQLKPIFDKVGLNVYNCNPNSGLKVFPHISVEEAISRATIMMPKDIKNERTAGLYDRKAEEKKKKGRK